MRKTPLIALASLLGGCVSGPAPMNALGSAWQPAEQILVRRCAAAPERIVTVTTTAAVGQTPRDILSSGDRVRVTIMGDVDRLSGVYVIDSAGALTMPGVPPIAARGADSRMLEHALRDYLVQTRVVRPLSHAVSVLLIELAPVDVAISGAVFQPGMVRVGERDPDARVGQREGAASGDRNPGRTLMAALRTAGGVRPDADVAHVKIVRGSTEITADLSGALDGSGTNDLPLFAEDRIVVPSTGCFSEQLARTSAITPAGVRVYMSNLSRPAGNNAGAGVGKESSSLPYGTRLLQALASMNCVGGSVMNSGRRAVLISRNPINGQSVVVERPVEDLVRGVDRDARDPFIMPDDAIACYDSRWTNVQDALGLLGTAAGIATPALLLRNAIK